MATEKQISANRANAKRSTGPKTAAGRAKSSRNAYRHGLSGDVPLENSVVWARMNFFAEALLAGKEPTEENMLAAAELAEAQAKILTIRGLRLDMLRKIQPSCGDLPDFSRMFSLDRYERLAHTKRRRASNKLK